VWAGYFVVPNDAGGLIQGVPLGPIEAAALLMLAWLVVQRAALPGAAVIGVLLALTWAAGAAIPGSGGLRARYYANDTATGAHERSTEFRGAAFTRIDERIDFVPGRRDFPLAFFNDNSRFNFYRAGEPQRDRLAFSVRWSGLWWVEGAREVYLHAPDADAEIAVDGIAVLNASPQSGLITRTLELTPGWHRLDIVFRAPSGSPRRFGAGVVLGGEPTPFDAASIVTQQIRGWQMRGAGLLRAIKTAVDLGALLWLAWLFLVDVLRSARQISASPVPAGASLGVAVLAVAGAIEAWVFAWPWSARLLVMVGGDDPMTYEGYARDILLNGILMNGGLPVGQGEPFYYQAFYPYFLAAVHAVFGEGMFGVMLIQRLLGVALAALLMLIAARLAGERTWPAALVCATLFVWWKFQPIALDLLSEALYIPLLAAATLTAIAAAQQPTVRRATVAGVLLGAATITRSTALLGWPAVLLAVWSAWRPVAAHRRLIAALFACAIAVFSLISVRNWIVAARFVPASTEFGVTLLGGNIPPDEVTFESSPRFALYQRLAIAEPTARVIEFAITAPGAFAANIGRKALFALGFYEPYAEGWGTSPVYVMVWTTAIAGLLLGRHPDTPFWVFVLPALIALSQYVAVVLVYPKGERLILPIHTLLVPYSAMAAATLLDRVRRPARAQVTL
jgi:hypothetical protein